MRRGAAGSAFLMTQAFSLGRAGALTGVLSLVFWFAPPAAGAGSRHELLRRGSGPRCAAIPIAYALVVLFLEPFYVAAGFAMYLNRRAELEAWDIEQEFRRAFAG